MFIVAGLLMLAIASCIHNWTSLEHTGAGGAASTYQDPGGESGAAGGDGGLGGYGGKQGGGSGPYVIYGGYGAESDGNGD